ncbi:hypothetical protein D3273_22695 [Lichenibacterium minor]|uniref:Uncharacterized protein n=1 Tax=Lichenibacterium minor TaxID=2316528 RepID=A0A4Q2U457_9HYPH|nr:hypothetical protein [Lichenibacterium minor]RYC29687.1 hypothetical protein D3273_22695 [Lichenibacterium minor]
MMKLIRLQEFNIAASAVVAAALTGLAYDYLGFLGVALVGLAILLTSAQADLQKETFRGLIAMEGMSPSERRARSSNGHGMSKAWRLARGLGIVLTIIGGVGFFLLQLPH